VKTLTKSAVDSNPIKQFAKWYKMILKSGIKEPTAMSIATATKKGVPSVRTVLLKGFDESGFLFFTNYKSRKGKELTENPFAEFLFYWRDLQRQVRISGKVEKVSKQESEDYFKSRPLKSKIGAWASKQSEVIPDREYLEKQFKEFTKKYSERSRFAGKKNVPLPSYWGGFRLIPERFEFWQGRENRLHDRICYIKKNNKWKIVRLAP